jgi:hypothetical protein
MSDMAINQGEEVAVDEFHKIYNPDEKSSRIFIFNFPLKILIKYTYFLRFYN